MSTVGESRALAPAVPRSRVYRRQDILSAISRRVARVAIHLILYTGMVAVLFPFFWMLSTSLKPRHQVFVYPIRWIPNPPRWENYVEALTIRPFGAFFLNSAIIAISATLGTLISSSLVAFAFARLRWPERDWLFLVVLATMMMPFHVRLVPNFVLFRYLGWINTFKPLILPFFTGVSFHIFLLRQFFMTIPLEMDDAAKIDGCSLFGIYSRILLPLSKPALGMVAVFSFQGRWRDFMSPLIYVNTMDKYTVAMGLNLFRGEFGTDWHWLMAVSLAAMLPVLVLFFFAQRHFIQGVVFTGLKGGGV